MTDSENIKTRYIRKRDGRIVAFDPDKITDAVFKAAVAVGGKDREAAESVTESVIGILDIIYKDGRIPTVENVQDLVEKMLIERGHAKVARPTLFTGSSTGNSGRPPILSTRDSSSKRIILTSLTGG
jgi:hypothetical protein